MSRRLSSMCEIAPGLSRHLGHLEELIPDDAGQIDVIHQNSLMGSVEFDGNIDGVLEVELEGISRSSGGYLYRPAAFITRLSGVEIF